MAAAPPTTTEPLWADWADNMGRRALAATNNSRAITTSHRRDKEIAGDCGAATVGGVYDVDPEAQPPHVRFSKVYGNKDRNVAAVTHT